MVSGDNSVRHNAHTDVMEVRRQSVCAVSVSLISHDLEVFYVLQLPFAVEPHSYNHIKILHCDQGNSSTKWNSHATIMWLALTPGLGVDHYELPLKANFILYINSLNWATQ